MAATEASVRVTVQLRCRCGSLLAEEIFPFGYRITCRKCGHTNVAPKDVRLTVVP